MLVEFPIQHWIVGMDRQGGLFRVTAQSDGTLTATADALSNSFLAGFQTVSDLKVVEYGYSTVSKESNLTPPTGDIAGEQKAQIVALLDVETPPNPGQDRYGRITIPAPKNSLFLATSGDGNNIVDTNNADLLSYLDLWTAGIALPGFVVSDFQHIQDPTTVGNITGKRITRRNKRG
jgi:hypothetical protein